MHSREPACHKAFLDWPGWIRTITAGSKDRSRPFPTLPQGCASFEIARLVRSNGTAGFRSIPRGSSCSGSKTGNTGGWA